MLCKSSESGKKYNVLKKKKLITETFNNLFCVLEFKI